MTLPKRKKVRNKMAYILCIETSTTNCSVALSNNESVLAFREDTDKGYSHAERLHVFIEEVLEEANIPKEELAAIAVSKGPGSYTGLRIGVSAAKGLCFALGLPLIAIPTLTILAQQTSENAIIVPLLDARRMEVYSAVFNEKKEQIRETKAEIVTGNSFNDYLSQGKTIFIGNGATKLQEIIDHENATFMGDVFPSSQHMASMAHQIFEKGDFESVAYFEPYYLKDFMIQRKG